MRHWRGDGVPALLDIGAVSGVETVRQAHHPVLELRALQITDAVERREFARCKLPDTFDDGLDQIGLGMGEALGLREFLDPRIDADGEELVGGRRGEGGHCERVLEKGESPRTLGRAGKRI